MLSLMKRSLRSIGTTFMQKTTVDANKLLISCEEDEPHPHCPHGATLLFYRALEGKENGYYGCAAHRDKRSCSFQLPTKQLTKKHLSRRYDVSATLQEQKQLRSKFLDETDASSRHYCLSCSMPLLGADLEAHASHKIKHELTPAQIADPTQFLPPLDDDKAQAQYFFDEKALRFFATCFQQLCISKVVCIGAPRLHAYLRSHCPNVQSFLLDFDNRLLHFFADTHFAWYNMCNNHFFDSAQQAAFLAFLKCPSSENVLIFTDPPFGCRTEPIAHTLHQLTQLYSSVNNAPYRPLPIFWIFPYFSEHYIQSQMPALQMCDYKVNYTNHMAYTDSGPRSRKLGSPVRIFTNVPLERLQLPVQEQYKYCVHCQRYTALENRHCLKCAACPSKNGCNYRHCERCGICVKPSYVHCVNCRRCTQLEGHNCQEYQKKLRCWICLQVGHNERSCRAWQAHCKKVILPPSECGKMQSVITCLLCGRAGHNERRCSQRSKYIEEVTFLGEAQLKFKT